MKTGRTLNEIAQELTSQRADRRDFVTPTGKLNFDANLNTIEIGDKGRFEVSPHTHGQISSWAKIPKAYYDRMRSASPDLLERNVKHWLDTSKDKRMVRTLGGNARAFLSDKYRAFDNYEVAEHALEALQAADCRIESVEVTDRRFYLKAVSERITGDVGVGDIVQSGIVISNSEIGAGSLRVEPLVFKLSCLNGMITADSSFRRNHVGSALMKGDRDGAIEFFTDETKKKSDEVIFLQVRDIVQGMMTDTGFAKVVAKFKAAKEIPLTGDAFETVEELGKKWAMSETESRGILSSLIMDEAEGNNLFGLVNAVTDYSKKVEDYDRATEFERLGGKILEAEFSMIG